jgi:predicted phosphate transport protein (TIGR00153 family)
MPTNPIYRLFGHSPIGPLQAHMDKVNQCAQLLPAFFDAVFANDWPEAAKQQAKIAELEREADELKKQLRLNLPRSLFLPIQRGDLLEMLTLQDKIANKSKDIAGIILGRQLKFPPEIISQYTDLLKRCLDATSQAHKAISELDSLLEAGFRGYEANLVEEMIHTLDDIENDTDTIQVRVRKQLYELEKDLPPVDVIFLYKIIEWTGDLADRAQQVGGQLELMLAR